MGDFASNLRKRRTELKMTQEELARRVGVSQVAIHQYESGTATPKMAIAVKLAKVLKTSCENLIE